VRAIKKDDIEGDYIRKYDTSSLKGIHLAGERCDPETILWLLKQFPDITVNDNYWQTESGWAISANYLNLTNFKIKPGSATKPCPGWDVKILDDQKHEITEKNKAGQLVIKLPCPPGHMDGLWGNETAYFEKYLS
jgi:propionyl-CoA synthetase